MLIGELPVDAIPFFFFFFFYLGHTSGRRTRYKLTPASAGLGFDSACPPGFRTQLHVTTALSTGGGPVSYVHLSEESSRFQSTPPACDPGSPELSRSYADMAST